MSPVSLASMMARNSGRIGMAHFFGAGRLFLVMAREVEPLVFVNTSLPSRANCLPSRTRVGAADARV